LTERAGVDELGAESIAAFLFWLGAPIAVTARLEPVMMLGHGNHQSAPRRFAQSPWISQWVTLALKPVVAASISPYRETPEIAGEGPSDPARPA
jgi:hypothetical protein